MSHSKRQHSLLEGNKINEIIKRGTNEQRDKTERK
jgi:hypothetical protein